jgi:hypothetical protein
MRILFDPAVYSLCNKGNIAILQAAVHRMRKFWPEASIEIIALESQRLRLYVPDSRQVYPYSGGVAKKRLLMRRLYRFIPSRALKASLELQEAVRYQWKPLERGVRNFQKH